MVAYSNEAKSELLGVTAELIEAHGAVSPEVAEAMADGRAGALRGRRRDRDHRDRRPGRRHRGKARGLRLHLRQATRGEVLARDPVLPGDRTEIRDRAGDRRAAFPAARRGAAVGEDFHPRERPGVEPYEIAIAEEPLDDLRERLARTRWPDLPGRGWLGVRGRLRLPARALRTGRTSTTGGPTEARLNALENCRWDGLHFIWARAGGMRRRAPGLLIHGWPGAPLEFEELMPLLAEAGHESSSPRCPAMLLRVPDPPLNAARSPRGCWR